MTIDFIPGPATATALIAAGTLPIWLMLLSHGPWKIVRPGKRFVLAALLSLGTWVVTLFLWPPGGAIDLISGASILILSLLAGFTLWTLVAWGFTLSMLLALRRTNRTLSLKEWIASYTGGKTVEAFGRDRLGVLFRFKLADRTGADEVEATGNGRRVAVIAIVLRKLFGLRA
jgi:hypothetical protein